jgi:hypothetical protein
MTEADRLNQTINELKQWQTVAWRRIADPGLTPFEGREIRNHLRESELALRYYLTMMSERLRFGPQPVIDVSNSRAKLNYRRNAQTAVK